MPIISSSLHGIISSSQHLLPSLPQYLFFLIVILGSASLFPCCLSLDGQYQYCQNNTKCGIFTIRYPFGVGSRGCGLPNFQMNCVQNSSLFITIRRRNYTILAFLSHTLLVITRGQNCPFLNNSTNNPIQSSEFGGTVFTFQAAENPTLYLYKCKEQSHLDLPKCNATLYYSLYANTNPNYSYEKENSTSACSMERVPVNGALIEAASAPKDESCRSCEASDGICGYNTSVSTAAAPFVCHCEYGQRTDKCPGHEAEM